MAKLLKDNALIMKNNRKNISVVFLSLLFLFIFFSFTLAEAATIIGFTPPPPGTLQRGNETTAQVTIQNTQDTPRSFWVGLSFAHETTTGDDWPRGWYDIQPIQSNVLEPGDTQQINFEFKILETLRAGQYYAVSRTWDRFDAELYRMDGSIDSTLWHPEHPKWATNPDLGMTSFSLDPFEASNETWGIINQFTLLHMFVEGSDLLEEYVGKGRKPLLYLGASHTFYIYDVPVEVGGAVFVDLADMTEVTPEGKDEWTTIWIAGNLGGVSFSRDLSSIHPTVCKEIQWCKVDSVGTGFVWHDFDYDYRGIADYIPAQVSEWFKASIPFFSLTAFSYDSDDNFKWWRAEPNGSLKLGFVIEQQNLVLAKKEVRTSVLLKALQLYGLIPTGQEQIEFDSIEFADNVLSLLEIISSEPVEFRNITYDDGDWPLVKGVPEHNLSMRVVNNNWGGSMHRFYIDVPENATNLSIQTSGPPNSGDLEIMYHLNVRPGTGVYGDKTKHTPNTTNEIVEEANPDSGRYYIGLRTEGEGEVNNFYFDDVTLVATYDLETTNDNEFPILSNPSVNPTNGTTTTQFEFLVDYYDTDGDPPMSGQRKLLLEFPDGTLNEYAMTLKSGVLANGTYKYETTLSQTGTSYRYRFSFADITGKITNTDWESGPNVYSNENIIITPIIQSTNISCDLNFSYSTTGFGNMTNLPILNSPILDPIVVSPGTPLYFQAGVQSVNFEYREQELWQAGNILDAGTGSAWSYPSLSPGEYGLNVYYGYTPHQYTISGEVLKSDGIPVSEGVELILTSPEQTLSQITYDGSFSFTGVSGGVTVTIEMSLLGGEEYEFSPSKLVYHCLKEDKINQMVTAYDSDVDAPSITINTKPLFESTSSSVFFSWIGQDEETPVEQLLYQYKLEGIDSEWSIWSPETTKSYILPNGVYTFYVTAKDGAENINQTPASYTFVVNAEPNINSAIRIDRSVWASRLTLEMPVDATQPTDQVILLYEHSGMSDPDLVPVTIHNIDNITPIGANEIIASQLGLPAAIVPGEEGWVLTLPESIPLNQTVQYDIRWGKVEYFGWKEYESVKPGFKNGGNIHAYFLDDNYYLWRSAFMYHDRGGVNQGDTCNRDGWLFLNISNNNETIKDETLRFVRGECLDLPDPHDSDGTRIQFFDPHFYKESNNILLSWIDYKFSYDYPNRYDNYRYGLEVFDSAGNSINAVDGNYVERDQIIFPSQLINNTLWLTGLEKGAKRGDPNYLWFHVFDASGNDTIPRTVFDTLQNDNGINLQWIHTDLIGSNILLLWNKGWNTPQGDDRIEIVYQIRDSNGLLIKDTDSFHPPVPPDSSDIIDRYYIETVLTDSNGKVWISFEHYYDSPSPTNDFYYIILDSDGNIWKGPVQTQYLRRFNFNDKDGYIWAEENGQFFVLNPDDTTVFGPRTPAWDPNQIVGQIAAYVNSSGYRLYDRWSPQVFTIDVPSNLNPNTMELYNLNLWGNDLHPANLTLKKGNMFLWSQDGQFTGNTTINVSSSLNPGLNVITMTQDDFLGGQVLITFPFEETFNSCGNGIVEAGEECDDGNIQNGDCCSSSCVYEPEGSSCTDGQYCNGGEVCNGAGACQTGPSIDCNDGVSCTVDTCDEVNDECEYTLNDSFCNNGQFCDGLETCDPINDCTSAGNPCPDGEICNEEQNLCFPESCDPHPADLNQNYILEMGEILIYRACFLTLGCEVGGESVSIQYAVSASSLFLQTGGINQYTCDPDATCPSVSCWIPAGE
jgi:cysteine-rich repeat protein